MKLSKKLLKANWGIILAFVISATFTLTIFTLAFIGLACVTKGICQ